MISNVLRLSILTGMILLLINACVTLPDLSPDNNQGPEMGIFVVNDTIDNYEIQSDDGTREYDLDQNGQADITLQFRNSNFPSFESNDYHVDGMLLNVLVMSYQENNTGTDLNYPIYPLKPGDIVGNDNLVIGAIWQGSGSFGLQNNICFDGPTPNNTPFFVGIRFLDPLNNNFFLGYIECLPYTQPRFNKLVNRFNSIQYINVI